MRTRRGKTIAGHDAPFALESDLCNVLSVRLLAALRLDGRAEMLGSIQVGTVVPDLVAVYRRSPSRSRYVSGLESWIVAYLLRRPQASLQELAERLFIRAERAESALTRLQDATVVRRLASGGFVVRRGMFPATAHVIAIEAKLRRWREAVDQAATYRRFANRSFVALPQAMIERTSGIRDACRARGLGLIAVCSNGVHVVRPADRHRPVSWEWVWIVAQAGPKSRLTPSPMPVATLAGDRGLCAD